MGKRRQGANRRVHADCRQGLWYLQVGGMGECAQCGAAVLGLMGLTITSQRAREQARADEAAGCRQQAAVSSRPSGTEFVGTRNRKRCP